MSSTLKNDKSFSDVDNTASSPQNTFAHKSSLRGTKLARRARSFKDDFLEKISQIRTPTNTLGRSHSPNSPRMKQTKTALDDVKPIQDLNYHVRQVKHALTHFKDVISKKKLEMLPGNGTVVLESIANVHTALQSYTLNEHSSALISATTQVYLSLGKLIKLCDEVLLSENEENCASLSNENVAEVVELVDNAVQNLVKLANEKISERDNALSYSGSCSSSTTSNTLRPIIDIAGQRTSLPDIPLTPRERDILEQSSTKSIRTSHSTESILRDSSPPPKPPLPNRSSNPPPLPPKRRSQQRMNQNDSDYGIDSSLLTCGLDRMSLRSRSPDDNSSLLSASSLDSALNHSREEEEIRALTMDQHFGDDRNSKEDIDKFFEKNATRKGVDVIDSAAPVLSITEVDLKNQRNSNESGFASMQSFRASTQSTSIKRASEQSAQSSKSSYITNSDDSFDLVKSTSISQPQQQQTVIEKPLPTTGTTQIALSCFTNEAFSAISTIGQSSMVMKSSFTNAASTNTSTKQTTISNSSSSSSTETERVTAIAASSTKFLAKASSVEVSNFSSENLFALADTAEEEPPALPVKTRSRGSRRERHISQYDNVEEADTITSAHILKNFNETRLTGLGLHSKHQSLIEPRRMNHFESSEQPPPLPVKKKHMFQSVAYSVMAYMEMFGNCSHSTQNTSEFMRHSVHTYNVTHSSSEHTHNQNITHSQTMSLSPLRKQIITESVVFNIPQSTALSQHSSIGSSGSGGGDGGSRESFNSDENPPALPPKRQNSCKTQSVSYTPPSSPRLAPPVTQKNPPTITNENNSSSSQVIQSKPINNSYSSNNNRSSSEPRTINNNSLLVNEELFNKNTPNSDSCSSYIQLYDGNVVNHSNSSCSNKQKPSLVSLTGNHSTTNSIIDHEHHKHHNEKHARDVDEDDDNTEVVLRRNQNNKQENVSILPPPTSSAGNLIEDLDVSKFLVLKKDGEDGPEVKGGYPDALIVHASKVQKVSENAFGEAFITTFRTFITPLELIEKLTHRYTLFCCQINDQKQKSAKESFSLLVRVVNDLTAPDLTSQHLSLLNDFVYQLVCSGQLMLAKLLRTKILEKIMIFKQQKWSPANPILSSRAIVTSPPSLLELKSAEIAAQMTLLDAELFQKIEIPEVLIWAQEQCEERSPNLTRFTEHFNKMSYWARSQILKQEDAKDREKHVIKFIKIMKHLRKINNYNSYLALLSALDSAPIRRLEWHKTITEGLKEYCALIDSSSSFRAYRQALAETNPPCIPYIGLVLQDLTFVHIGNQDFLSEGVINFSKRWQQHNIVVNMKRFKKCSAYPFKKNERIISFFDNFENYLDEDAMWQISENIKPRVSRKPIPN